MKIKPEEQAALINDAIGGKFQAVTWRNHPGGDPDTQYVWWYDGNPDPKVGQPGELRADQRPGDRQAARPGPLRARPGQAQDDLRGPEPGVRQEGVERLGAGSRRGRSPRPRTSTASSGRRFPTADEPNPGLAVGHTLIGMWISK